MRGSSHIKAMVIVLLAAEDGGCRGADHVIIGQVAGRESRVLDRAEPGVFNYGSRPFERW